MGDDLEEQAHGIPDMDVPVPPITTNASWTLLNCIKVIAVIRIPVPIRLREGSGPSLCLRGQRDNAIFINGITIEQGHVNRRGSTDSLTALGVAKEAKVVLELAAGMDERRRIAVLSAQISTISDALGDVDDTREGLQAVKHLLVAVLLEAGAVLGAEVHEVDRDSIGRAVNSTHCHEKAQSGEHVTMAVMAYKEIDRRGGTPCAWE